MKNKKPLELDTWRYPKKSDPKLEARIRKEFEQYSWYHELDEEHQDYVIATEMGRNLSYTHEANNIIEMIFNMVVTPFAERLAAWEEYRQEMLPEIPVHVMKHPKLHKLKEHFTALSILDANR